MPPTPLWLRDVCTTNHLLLTDKIFSGRHSLERHRRPCPSHLRRSNDRLSQRQQDPRSSISPAVSGRNTRRDSGQSMPARRMNTSASTSQVWADGCSRAYRNTVTNKQTNNQWLVATGRAMAVLCCFRSLMSRECLDLKMLILPLHSAGRMYDYLHIQHRRPTEKPTRLLQ